MPGEILEVYSSADQVGQDLGQATFLPFEEDHSQRVGPEVPREDHSNSRPAGVSGPHSLGERGGGEAWDKHAVFRCVYRDISR